MLPKSLLCPYIHYFIILIKKGNGSSFLLTEVESFPIFRPKFWKNVINVWASVKDDSSTAPEEILSQPIWHNGRIRVGGQPVFFSHWTKSGIFFINDLIKKDGSLLSLTDLKYNYNINIIFLEYHPQEWKSILRDNQIEKLDEICNKNILLLRVNQRVVKPFY